MSNIIIYSDLQNTYTDYFDVMVNKIEDYVDVYRSILEAIYNQQSLVVVVRDRFSINCFRKMQERYNQQILIKVNSPREQFYNMVGIRVPDYITEEEIIKDRFIDKAKGILFNRGMSFEDNILSHYLGGYFTNPCFPFSKLVDFLKKLDLKPLKVRDGGIILNKIYNKRIKLWQENSCNESERNIINAFLDNHEALITKVSKYLILKKYPKNLIEDIVGNLAKDFDTLKIKDAPFISNGMDTVDIQRNLRIYFNQKNISGFSYDDIIREIEHLSGLFNEELQYAYNLLNQNQNVLDVSILYKIRSKFKNGSQLDPMFNEKLNNAIPPAEVTNPENIDNIDDWVLWAQDSYLPYRFWMEANNVYNEQIDKYSLLYGDWIFCNYDKLVFSESRMLYKTIVNLSSYLRKDELSLIVIIDNFNYKYAQLCKDYFSIKGFSNTMDQPLISMIPTETSVSKTAFFSGQPFNTEDKSYDSMCKEWQVLLGGNIEYLSDIGKLDSIHENPAKVYFLNYLSVDKILHESQKNSALPLSLRIQEELKAMMDKIINFAKRLGMENKIKVYFISDHGSTKISGKQQNLIDSKYYKAKSEDCAYRVIALQDKIFHTYKDSIGHLCYVLDRNHYGIKQNYLIAKGYNRFMETDLSFYVHGGITPEENIIPLLKFEHINIKLIPPEILLRNNEFRYSTISRIHLTIKNHNEYSIDNIEFTIHNSNIRWEKGIYILPKVEKESQVDIYLEKVRLLKSSIDKEVLRIKIRFSFLGQDYEREHEFSINMKSIQENKFDFDDLL